MSYQCSLEEMTVKDVLDYLSDESNLNEFDSRFNEYIKKFPSVLQSIEEDSCFEQNIDVVFVKLTDCVFRLNHMINLLIRRNQLNALKSEVLFAWADKIDALRGHIDRYAINSDEGERILAIPCAICSLLDSKLYLLKFQRAEGILWNTYSSDVYLDTIGLIWPDNKQYDTYSDWLWNVRKYPNTEDAFLSFLHQCKVECFAPYRKEMVNDLWRLLLFVKNPYSSTSVYDQRELFRALDACIQDNFYSDEEELSRIRKALCFFANERLSDLQEVTERCMSFTTYKGYLKKRTYIEEAVLEILARNYYTEEEKTAIQKEYGVISEKAYNEARARYLEEKEKRRQKRGKKNGTRDQKRT